MPDKDINIHIKAQDVEQSKQKVESFADSVENFGQKTEQSQKTISDSTENASQKLNSQGGILDALKSKFFSFLTVTGVLALITKSIEFLNQRLEQSTQLTKEFYDSLIKISNAGQKLEFQLGTTGKQTEWGLKALEIQKAGGFSDSTLPIQLMAAVQEQYRPQGGIQNQEIFNFLKDLSPVIGAAGLNQQEIDSLFHIVDKAKIPADTQAFKNLIAKMRAASSAGKMTINEFLSDTERSNALVRYLSTGGTIDHALSLYFSARDVSANKQGGNTLLQLVADIASGKDKDIEKIIQSETGTQFENLTTDQKSEAVLRYINSLPENRRVKILQTKGFQSPEDLSLLATPAAREIYETTKKAAAKAKKEDIEPIVNAYTQSAGFQQAQTQIEIEIAKTQSVTSADTLWQNRLDRAKGFADILIKQKKDNLLVTNKREGVFLAYQQMLEEAESLLKENPDQRLRQLILSLRAITTSYKMGIGGPIELLTEQPGPLLEDQLMNARARITSFNNFNPAITEKLPFLEQPWNMPFAPAQPQQGPVNINYNNDNSLNIYPTIGQFEPNRIDFNE